MTAATRDDVAAAIAKFIDERGVTRVAPSSRKIKAPATRRRGRYPNAYQPPLGYEALYRKTRAILGPEEAQRQIEALALKESRR